MDVLFLIGRILLGGFFIFNGFNHLIKVGIMAPYAGSKGVPAPSLAVVVTGMLLLLGGLSVVLGIYRMVGFILLIIFLVPVTFIMHAFWNVEDPQARAAEMINFTKNLALLGAILMIMAVPHPWPLSLAG